MNDRSEGQLPAADVLAIDVGSSCIKLGWFADAGPVHASDWSLKRPVRRPEPSLPAPDLTAHFVHRSRAADDWGVEIDRWVDELAVGHSADCLIGSVHPGATAALLQRLQRRRWGRLHQLAAHDLALEVRTAEPARVGVDRLLGALAVNRARNPLAAAIAVDMGTAITVDLISADGAFEGGAILAGPVISLGALHAGTASLPAIDERRLAKPRAAVGKSTEEALVAGAYWGAVGGVCELMARMAEHCDGEPDLFLTGGAADEYAAAVTLEGRLPRHVPHLVLAGIRLAAEELSRR
jgi:type III pantothenate kinase